jgi:hypothetical protein
MTTTEIAAELQRRLDPAPRIDARVSRFNGNPYLNTIPKIRCVDGLELSAQASHHHYCTPRDSVGPWTHVEVGFPTARVDLLMPYVEDESDPTGTVYGFVPIGVVAEAIEQHGGFATLLPSTKTRQRSSTVSISLVSRP